MMQCMKAVQILPTTHFPLRPWLYKVQDIGIPTHRACIVAGRQTAALLEWVWYRDIRKQHTRNVLSAQFDWPWADGASSGSSGVVEGGHGQFARISAYPCNKQVLPRTQPRRSRKQEPNVTKTWRPLETSTPGPRPFTGRAAIDIYSCPRRPGANDSRMSPRIWKSA